MTEAVYVGIDVAKKHLDYTWLPDGSKYRCENTEEGLDSLITGISKFEVGLVTLEATGGYHNLAVRKLQEAGLPVAVVNPRQVRDLAKASGRLAKTDRLDAAMIARYGQMMQPSPQVPKEPVRVEIENLARRRNQLVTLRHMEKNHLENADAKIRQSIDLVMNLLTCQIDEIEKELKETVSSDQLLARQYEIITSIPGVGLIMAAMLLGSMPELGHINRKQAASIIGVAPFNHDSGQKQGRRQIVGGRAKIRDVLYMAVIAGIRFNVKIKNFYHRLINAGKKPKVAIVACMRKLIVILNTMLKNNLKWTEPNIDLSA